MQSIVYLLLVAKLLFQGGWEAGLTGNTNKQPSPEHLIWDRKIKSVVMPIDELIVFNVDILGETQALARNLIAKNLCIVIYSTHVLSFETSMTDNHVTLT